jgi:hypothetical protein
VANEDDYDDMLAYLCRIVGDLANRRPPSGLVRTALGRKGALPRFRRIHVEFRRLFLLLIS